MVRLYAEDNQSRLCEMEEGQDGLYFNPPVYPVYAGPVAVFVLLGWIAWPFESVVNEVYIVTALAHRASAAAVMRKRMRGRGRNVKKIVALCLISGLELGA